eukprot:TRINITY_DN16011_c0_g1_i1.p1 TRINITY_DN16011_c0_g1~~TRINITY_DN16011_c0_g1_i1.p1  ORF type:complete len:614 (+),score=175.30 TRINITY_DN16011_c0_g1_i1:67-1908(+)
MDEPLAYSSDGSHRHETDVLVQGRASDASNASISSSAAAAAVATSAAANPAPPAQPPHQEPLCTPPQGTAAPPRDRGDSTVGSSLGGSLKLRASARGSSAVPPATATTTTTTVLRSSSTPGVPASSRDVSGNPLQQDQVWQGGEVSGGVVPAPPLPVYPTGALADDERLLVRVCSWNVGESAPKSASPRHLREWLLGVDCECRECGEGKGGRRGNQQFFFHDRHIHEPDVVAVGIQEVDMSCWAMWLGCCSASTTKGVAWSSALSANLQGYTLVAEEQLMGLLLVVFVSDDIASRHDVTTDVKHKTCGFFGAFGNKGGIAARFTLGDPTTGTARSLCFVNCHLAAQKKKIEKRNMDHDAILDGIKFLTPPHAIMDHDYAFWFGDLNYRLETTTENLMTIVTPAACHVEREDILWEGDQLLLQMQNSRVFSHFKEAKIKWCPTYKFKKGDAESYCTKREPSYCDRILYYTYTSNYVRNGAKQVGYDYDTEAGACSESPLLAHRIGQKSQLVSMHDEMAEVSISTKSPETPLQVQSPESPVDGGYDEEAPKPTPSAADRATRQRDSPLLRSLDVDTARKVHSGQRISCLEYATVDSCAGSDHRPVYGLYLVNSVL